MQRTRVLWLPSEWLKGTYHRWSHATWWVRQANREVLMGACRRLTQARHIARELKGMINLRLPGYWLLLKASQKFRNSFSSSVSVARSVCAMEIQQRRKSGVTGNGALVWDEKGDKHRRMKRP